jgi:TonB family protein
MRDRVAEVLAERATLDNGAAAGLALSVALHAAITAAAVYAALHRPAPQLANVLNIRFAPAPQAAEPLTTPAAPPAAPKLQEAPKPVPKIPTPVAQPTPPKPVPQPVMKNTAPPDAFGRSNKKPGAAPLPAPQPAASTAPVTAQPTHAPAVPGVANPNDIAAGNSGVTGLEGGDFPYTIYIDRMRNLIGTHWFRPQGTSAAAATIHFVINRDGTIRDVTLDTSSGNGVFDRAAQRAVVEASPLPPLPFAYSGTYLGVHLTFR